MKDVYKSFGSLKLYCEKEQFKGWDPYDGLNSKIFQSIPFLRKSAICRLVAIQAFKRFPVNLRRLALVPKEYNAKGIGLFLSGYCNLYKAVIHDGDLAKVFGTPETILNNITKLADLLIDMQSVGYSGACWGYNFDWQARRLFLFPKNTPTVVATTFCASALFEAYELTMDETYLKVAISSADFVMKDLNRTQYKEGYLFSYSPLKGNDTVFNASLLGSKLLGLCYKYTGNNEYKEVAERSVKACCSGQKEDGSWPYGLLPVQSWIDSFHTGYNLDALVTYQECTGDTAYSDFIEKGFNFYIDNFFESDGTPKYYHDKMFPIDIHCPGQLFVTLYKTGKYACHKKIADDVFSWTVKNMQHDKGYFYYQMKPYLSSRISYMRWSNAFMFNALSYYILLKEDSKCKE